MQLLRFYLVCAAAFTIPALAGCGISEPPKYEISGTVTFKGIPLKVGSFDFRPEGASCPTYAGTQVIEGGYKIPAGNGLQPGWYKVSISSVGGPPLPPSGRGMVAPKEVIPERFRSKTTLRVEVKAERPNVFPFDLK